MSVNLKRTQVRVVECPECLGVRRDDDRLCFTCFGAGEVGRDLADAYLEGLNKEVIYAA
jgi:hypothetical protein